ncbi:DUF3299 domain-containing protein [Herbaspirillum sp. RTI4]|uniref:DUF3299 domain-containing protein n=1 Tax=Herbaspirillum sp. RTI4 TaxID=3048640 RepID=UPI002AB47AE2|nr:DUF3299 domain-containing protein [Herbaspirillum sp. RTI4]MDY7579328.1 DUF3299 domain-containing protein [Herbaspirillum sp. RTI4]MEA9980242.1 DUF3299 domain-containing protein [Herbaspirillum sp. RTI4]
MKLKNILWIIAIVGAGIALGGGVQYALRPAAAPATPYQIGQTLPAAPLVASLTAPVASTVEYHDIKWEDLIPSHWDAMKPFKGLQLSKLGDEDPRAMQALEDAKEYWEKAPVDPKMEGKQVRIPGFVVSLEREGEALSEFLLVPYFGACIHIPPPPANQIIHARSKHAFAGVRTMDAVWITGTIKIDRTDTQMGAAGYSMTVVNLEPYVDAPESTAAHK